MWALGILWLAITSVACQGPPRSIDNEAVIEAGQTIYQEEGCVNCHGPDGTGDTGPALSNVLETFTSCDSQVEWVSLGSARWAQARGSSYGDTNKPVRGGMPGFGERLDTGQIRKVVSFTRFQFGGGEGDEVLNDCLGDG